MHELWNYVDYVLNTRAGAAGFAVGVVFVLSVAYRLLCARAGSDEGPRDPFGGQWE